MKVKHASLAAIAVLLAISLTASLAMACVPPEGESPGYWRNEVRRYVVEKGATHEDIIGLTAAINGGPWLTGMWYMGYWLPPLPDINRNGVFDINDAYEIFWNGPSSVYKPLWKGLANWYNWARGWAPVD